jgi:drug/metabolite transporter (DMT)-like permease
MNYPLIGPVHVLLAATLLAANGVLARIAYDAGANPLAFVTVRAGVTVAILWVWLILSAEPWKLSRRDRTRTIIIGLIAALNNYALNVAIAMIPVPLAVLIFYFYPVLTAIASVMLRREPFTLRAAIAIVLAFIGIALTLPDQPQTADVIGVAWAVLSAVTWAAVILLTGVWFPAGDARPRTLYIVATVFVVSSAFALVTQNVEWPESVGGAAGFIGGAVAFALGVMGLFIATSTLGPMRAAFYMNFEPVAAVILSALVLGQVLTKGQVLGAIMVVVALGLFRAGKRTPP